MIPSRFHFAVTSLAMIGFAASAQATTPDVGSCEAATVLLRDVTIIDASGAWAGQDLFIENGEIAVIGSSVSIERDDAIAVIDAAGGVVSPLVDDTRVLRIRTSAHSAPAAVDAGYVMPGEIANLSISDPAGVAVYELRDGRLLAAGQRCYTG